MAAHDSRRRIGVLAIAVLALAIPCLAAGCGGRDEAKPAPIEAAQAKKAQDYMANYREQMIAENKAKAKAKAEGKKSP